MKPPFLKTRPWKGLATARAGLAVGLLALAWGAAGCACCAPQPEPVLDEASVRPGINEPYLRAETDVDLWVGRFETESREVFRNRDRILEAVGLRPGQRVADIGAGTGLFVEGFSQAVGEAGKVYAVDLVPEFLELIQARAQERGWNNVSTVLCTERDVSLPPGSVDVAFLCDVYHHFEYPRSSLASIRRALRPGGELVVIDFRRIPGESSDWVLNHVRAGQDEVAAEIAAAGFERVETPDFLEENYLLRFRLTPLKAFP